MEHIKQKFSIKDLEHLSGVKAHTIRIWEKRYDVLHPDRTDTNIRTYDGENLQKLLNISFLNSHGYKISRISKMPEKEINDMVQRISASTSEENRSLNALKLSMMNFDEELFQKTYNKLREKRSFRNIFHEIFLPLLEEIGILWQTDTIKPIHEHYITELIKQKIYQNIADLKREDTNRDGSMYVLFLPENEIHDLGILYLNYEILSAGKKAIYLGPSLPMENIDYLLEMHDNLTFVTYLTVTPVNAEIEEFLEAFETHACREGKKELLLFGPRAAEFEKEKLPENIRIYQSIKSFLNTI